MQKILGLVVLVLGLYFGSVSLVSAVVCDGPVYCAGACGILSRDCTCTSQSCYLVTPLVSNNCWWDAELTTQCPISNDGYTCIPCLYCTTSNNTFKCIEQGAYVDPCYTGACTDGPPQPPPPPPPPPPPGVGWCTVSINGPNSVMTGEPVTGMMQANAQNAAGGTAYLKLVKQDHGPIPGWPVVASNQYDLGSCTSTTTNCNPAVISTQTLPTGKYYFYCGFPTDQPHCSGNPFCDYETPNPAVTPPQVACGGYASCNTPDTADNVYFEVVAPLVTVTANVYDGKGCTGGTTPAVGYTGGTVRLSNTSSTIETLPIANSATFSNVEGGGLLVDLNYTVSLASNNPTTWVSVCPPLIKSIGVRSTPVTVNFYVTKALDPWWRVVGGDGYGAGNIDAKNLRNLSIKHRL